MTTRRNWTREETILAMSLYYRIPYGNSDSRNPEVIKLAELIKRTPDSVSLKLANLASFDPYHLARGVTGMSHASRLDKEIWKEFENNLEHLAFESETILANKESITLEDKYVFNMNPSKEGGERLQEVKTRINQGFFRDMVLSNYQNTCAVSGINIKEVLIASHIIPWAKNEQERINPSNGICLSPLYDKLFDKGLITIDLDYKIQISNVLKEKQKEPFYDLYLGQYENQNINLPERFFPNKEFLEYHHTNIYQIK